MSWPYKRQTIRFRLKDTPCKTWASIMGWSDLVNKVIYDHPLILHKIVITYFIY